MTYQELLVEIKGHILNGLWKKGEKIPTFTELSSKYGVSVSTIREVLKVLEKMGYLSIQQGRGTFVSTIIPEEEANISPSSVFDLLKLTEYRMMIEPQFAAIAAKQAFPEEIEAIYHSAKRMNELSKQGLPTIEEDMRFHMMIVHATHNNFCIDAYLSIQPQLELGRSHTNIPGMKEKAAHYHLMIAEAIKHRNAEEAKMYMTSHMEGNLELAIYQLTRDAPKSFIL